MKYVGIQTQISQNNRKTILLLLAFPCILLALVYVIIAAFVNLGICGYDDRGLLTYPDIMTAINQMWLWTMPWVLVAVGIWFFIAYKFNSSMIQHATGARPVTRKENPRIYNIVENLCMACGMNIPKINVVNDPQLNAYASGINDKTYTVTVTTGICERLNDEELSGVIAHELTHIRNHDTKLLITSIVFVGIISTSLSLLCNLLRNAFFYGNWSTSSSSSSRSNLRSNDKEEDRNKMLAIVIAVVIIIVCMAIAYFFSLLTRFAISRKREFMADAGGAELCGNPQALASALRKISNDPGLDKVNRDDVAQLFICRPDEMELGFLDKTLGCLFSTHPDTKERIRILEQF